jgi:hypothetical protein
MRAFLPRAYLARFAAPGGRIPLIWVYRPGIGEWKPAPLEPSGPDRHFNAADEPELRKADALDDRLEALDPEVDRLVARLLQARSPEVAREARPLLSDWLALMAIRLSPRFRALDAAEAERGHAELRPVLEQMGWVLWEAIPPAYFITSSAPFHVAFPRDDLHGANQDLGSPGAEVTMPLSPRLVLHGTWKRRGELWKTAGEDALMEVNGRTMLRAARFLAAHQPQVPG